MTGAPAHLQEVEYLTIAVPTYNRNQTLLKNLQLLLPQLTSQCRLLIIDNCSDLPVEQTIAALLSERCSCGWQILRNASNIGANANVLRCFELCETRWLWVLGDDDDVYPDAVQKIFRTIHSHHEYIFCNYASEIFFRSAACTVQGLEQFILKLDDFSNILFISTGVYNAEKLRPYLANGYSYTGSYAPHLSLLLSAFKPQDTCLLSDDSIVHHDNHAPIRWSYVSSVAGWYDLLDLLHTTGQRKLLAAHFSLALQPVLATVTKQLVLMGLREGSTDNAVHFFTKIASRAQMYDRRIALRMRLALYSLFVRNPKLFAFFYHRLRDRNFAAAEIKALHS